LVVDWAGEVLDRHCARDRDGAAFEGGVVRGRLESDVDQRLDPGAAAVPIDLGMVPRMKPRFMSAWTRPRTALAERCTWREISS
jgi:hypothetical protein